MCASGKKHDPTVTPRAANGFERGEPVSGRIGSILCELCRSARVDQNSGLQLEGRIFCACWRAGADVFSQVGRVGKPQAPMTAVVSPARGTWLNLSIMDADVDELSANLLRKVCPLGPIDAALIIEEPHA